jgi:hypothetical protein
MKIDKGGSKYDKDKFWGSPTVKENAKQQNYNVFILFTNQIISDQKRRKKVK